MVSHNRDRSKIMPPNFLPKHNVITTKTWYLLDTRCIPLRENRLPKRSTARAKVWNVYCREHNALFDQIPPGA
jgi:hypothetical protein